MLFSQIFKRVNNFIKFFAAAIILFISNYAFAVGVLTEPYTLLWATQCSSAIPGGATSSSSEGLCQVCLDLATQQGQGEYTMRRAGETDGIHLPRPLHEWFVTGKKTCDDEYRYPGGQWTPVENKSTLVQIPQCPAGYTLSETTSEDGLQVMVCSAPCDTQGSPFTCPIPPPITPPEPPTAEAPEMCKPDSSVASSSDQEGTLVGNPIAPATSEKVRFETDWSDRGASSLSFQRIYRSNRGLQTTALPSALGQAWSHNQSLEFELKSDNAGNFAIVTLPEGYQRRFLRLADGVNWRATNSNDTLTSNAGGSWTYKQFSERLTYTFDSNKKIISKTDENGWTTTYSYNASQQLVSVRNHFNRTILFSYSGSRLTGITTPDGRAIFYGYDNQGRLNTVTNTDGSQRTYLYESSTFPQALTGLVDETGTRFATFAYDSIGRATSTELAGGVEKYQASYPEPKVATITDPLGTARTYIYNFTKNKLAVVRSFLVSNSKDNDVAARVQDSNGLITSEQKFNGGTTETTWDATRRLPLTVTDNVGTTTTQWHPDYPIPVLVTEPGRSVSFVYDAQGRLLSESTVQTASSDPGIPATSRTRTRSWTYNAEGLIATETAPNNSVTAFSYDSQGNMTSVTNALGHVRSYAFDSSNRVISETAPNGLVTTYGWDVRDRIISRTVGTQPSSLFTYNAVGKISSMKLPNGLMYQYTYDNAHRQTGWTNNRGETGSFTLDGMGNRISEQVRDSSGTLARQIVRTVNNINRVSQVSSGSTLVSSRQFDTAGLVSADIDGVGGYTRYYRDSRERVKQVLNAQNLAATIDYDSLDQIVGVTDFKQSSTAYARDVNGNATNEASPDIGTRKTEYDGLGLPVRLIDAMGQATNIQRDAIGRPTQITFADGQSTILRYDLSGSSYNAVGSASASIGYLSEIQDRSGILGFQRDAFGRIVKKSGFLKNGLPGTLTYAYTPSGSIESILYPGGPDHLLHHIYDATGRLVQMNWRGQPLITNIQWNPSGQALAWTWAFSNVPELGGFDFGVARSFNTAGFMTQVSFGSQNVLNFQYNAAGRITRLSQYLLEPVNPNVSNSTVAAITKSWNSGYDSTGKLTGFSPVGAGFENGLFFQYDPNGNRTQSRMRVGDSTTVRNFSMSANRPTGFSQWMDEVTTNVAFAYNANGDMVSDGLRTYTYNAEGRLSAVTSGATDASPTIRYAHNALGQRVFKTEPQYPPVEGDENDAGFMQTLIEFFKRLWSPATSQAEAYGFAYVYDEQGSLLGEYGMGGAQSTGSKQYVWLPSADGPIPVVTFTDSSRLAVISDHINTPRQLINPAGSLIWQWEYSAFGDVQPTVLDRSFNKVPPIPGEFTFNLRYPGQYFDSESGLHYNYFRSYSPSNGRYTQADPIGLDGGWNRFGYAYQNPLGFTDASGLQVPMPPPLVPMPGVPNPSADAQRALIDQFSRSPNRSSDDGKTYQTYTRYNPLTGQCYSGRTSGTDTPANNVRNRGYGQPLLNAEGFLPPILDRSSSDRSAIRGREQQLIDANGGAQSTGGDSRNMINGISPANPFRQSYLDDATSTFGTPVPAGRCTCQ